MILKAYTHGVEAITVPWTRYLLENNLFCPEHAELWKHWLIVRGGVPGPQLFLMNDTIGSVNAPEAWCVIAPEVLYTASLWVGVEKLPGPPEIVDDSIAVLELRVSLFSDTAMNLTPWGSQLEWETIDVKFCNNDLHVGWNRLYGSFKTAPWAKWLQLSFNRYSTSYQEAFAWQNNNVWITGVMVTEVPDPDNVSWHQFSITEEQYAHDDGSGWMKVESPYSQQGWERDYGVSFTRTDCIVPVDYFDGNSPNCSWQGKTHRSISLWDS